MKDPKDSQVVVSKLPKSFRLTHKQVMIGGIVLGVLLVLGAGTFLFLKHRTSTATSKVATALDTANKAMQAGDYKTATADLKAVESQPASKAEKLQLYTMLAGSAMAQDQAGDITMYYQKKHELDPSTAQQDAFDLGTYYDRTGDKDKAIEQYKIALQYLQSQPDTNTQRNMDLSTVQARLQDLGVQQ